MSILKVMQQVGSKVAGKIQKKLPVNTVKNTKKIAPKAVTKSATKISTPAAIIKNATKVGGKLTQTAVKISGLKLAVRIVNKFGKITAGGFKFVSGIFGKFGFKSGLAIGILGTVLLANIVPFAVITFRVIDRFDWMKPDKAINDEIENAFKQIYRKTGTALGVSLAWLTVGANGLLMMRINPNVAAQMFGRYDAKTKTWERGNFTEEASQEILAAVSQAIWAVYQAWSYQFFANEFIKARKWLIQRPNHPISLYLKNNLLGNEGWKNWGKEGQKPISIQKSRETAVNKIGDTNRKEVIEAGLEAYGDSIFDAAVTWQTTAISALESSQIQRQQKSRVMTVLSRIATGAAQRTKFV